ncbi:MAG: divergent PAP2 family protein [Oscillospiraceae bacterium]|jgi:acid phosphatase family membrane protein YuiD|nr:divergent PAP2 family protein [Oscillospiraceae bacterium]
MKLFQALTGNYIINVGFVSWFSAQIIKTVLTFIATKKVDLERLVGAGGMPSSHSALTSSIAIAMAKELGYTSPVFGLSLAFAAIVMYDAMGVRRAAGEQAKVLNKMIFEFSNFPFFIKREEQDAEPEKASDKGENKPGPIVDKELKEYLGHTPFEVLGGCLLGILVAIFMPAV